MLICQAVLWGLGLEIMELSCFTPRYQLILDWAICNSGGSRKSNRGTYILYKKDDAKYGGINSCCRGMVS